MGILIAVASTALLFFAFLELALAYPVPWWLYLQAGLLFLPGLVRRAPPRQQLPRLATFAAVSGFVAALYFVDWTSRKPFLRDLHRIQPGMTEEQVRQIMGKYMEGTGWPAPPGMTPGQHGTLAEAGSDVRYMASASAGGELRLHDSLVFRHSNDGAFNSDWGIVTFANGTVVEVRFSAD